ncbi:MAG TPA: PspA/IM30 family protein [Bryobacteraceae bacterium]|jgi:phage shock protein A|nr:PspA/IM30 family protein [Bryobacteraceae bacterium]
MALLERVSTLIKANLNDLVDRAENPEKLLKQLLLDMQNQFMQVKTQVAIAIADQHLLESKQRENLNLQTEWTRKAEVAVQRNQEDLARVALDRALTYEMAATNFTQQLQDQAHQVNTLRDALYRLESKMAETQAKSDLLLAQHRRARLMKQTGGNGTVEMQNDLALDRVRSRVIDAEVIGQGHQIAASLLNPDQRLNQLEKSDRVDRLLADLKAKLGR